MDTRKQETVNGKFSKTKKFVLTLGIATLSLAFVMAAAFFIFYTAPVNINIGEATSVVDFEVSENTYPGDRINQTISLSNNAKNEYMIQIWLNDTLPEDVVSNLPINITLPPYGSQDVDVEFNISKTAAPQNFSSQILIARS